ncbi:hypothetical protein KQ945_10045 [Bacillus subtilis subsp. subtilis]|nr:hypothetical protein [Bacillus subtilis subsp. subtilis]
MKFNALAQKAAKGSALAAYGGALEVEQLIAFALEHGDAGADEIERLCVLHGWLEDGMLADGTRVVPFARWANACAAYARDGVVGLRPLLADPAMATFAIGVLEEVRQRDAVAELLAYCEGADWRTSTADAAPWRALGALNMLLSFDDSVPVDATLQHALYETTVKAWGATSIVHLKAVALYALRGAPLAASLAWVDALPVARVRAP